jgi:hypothetical protein
MAKPQDHRGFCFGNWWRRRESNLRQRDRQRLILFNLFVNHLLAVDFKICFSGERRFFHSEGVVRTALFSFVSYNLGWKVIMNDRQTFFLLRGALCCYIEQTILKYEQAAQREAVAAEILRSVKK